MEDRAEGGKKCQDGSELGNHQQTADGNDRQEETQLQEAGSGFRMGLQPTVPIALRDIAECGSAAFRATGTFKVGSEVVSTARALHCACFGRLKLAVWGCNRLFFFWANNAGQGQDAEPN